MESRQSKSPVSSTTVTVGAANRATRLKVALSVLLERSLIQPETNNLYGEACLHAGISSPKNTYGLVFIKQYERYGKYKAWFMSYTRTNSSRDLAYKLLPLKKQSRNDASQNTEGDA